MLLLWREEGGEKRMGMDDARQALKRALIEATMLWTFELESERAIG